MDKMDKNEVLAALMALSQTDRDEVIDRVFYGSHTRHSFLREIYIEWMRQWPTFSKNGQMPKEVSDINKIAAQLGIATIPTEEALKKFAKE